MDPRRAVTYVGRLRKLVSVWFGLGTVIVAWAVDLRSRADFAFWLHLFGALAFWGGLTALDSHSEIARLIYCLINLGLVGFGLFLQRRAYALFGGLGIALYLHHLAERVFADSLLYPFALSLIGLAVIGAGLFLHRHAAALQRGSRADCRPGSPPYARRLRVHALVSLHAPGGLVGVCRRDRNRTGREGGRSSAPGPSSASKRPPGAGLHITLMRDHSQ